jgi:hypothetical protein
VFLRWSKPEEGLEYGRRVSGAAYALGVISFLVGSLSFSEAQVPASRLEALKRGSSYFIRTANGLQTLEGFKLHKGVQPTYANLVKSQREDFDIMKKIGMTCVRLPFSPYFFWDFSSANVTFKPNSIQFLIDTLKEANAAGLVAIVDMHDFGFNSKLKANPGQMLPKFGMLWASIANAIRGAGITSDEVAYELLNEPGISYAEGWWEKQGKILSDVRAVAPDYTCIVTGQDYSWPADLVAAKPYEDKNVLYNFHYYNPFIFTHQGTGWAFPDLERLTGVPYPYNDKTKPVLDNLLVKYAEDVPNYNALKRYVDEKWDIKRIESEIKQAVNWANANGGVKLICTEFGVYRWAPGLQNQWRWDWHNDMVSVFERYKIPWNMWEYGTGFSYVDIDADGNRWPSQAIYSAFFQPRTNF